MINAIEARECVKSLSNKERKELCPLRSLIASGNKKLPTTTGIFNMGSAHSCPSLKLGLCSAVNAGVKCYAIKAEYPYRPNVKPYREKQGRFWKSISAESFATQFLFLNAMKKKPFTALRLNEAGDFYSQACVDKLERIATYLKPYGVTVYVYTSRKDLDFTQCKNVIVIGSGFTKKGIMNEFKIVDDMSKKIKGYSSCALDCKICNKCLVRGNKIVVKKH